MTIEKNELLEAKRAIDSLLNKLRKTSASLIEKDTERYKSQITLAKNRIRALEISVQLIEREIEAGEND